MSKSNYILMALCALGVSVAIASCQPAHADSFGSQCVTRADGKMLCAFWQWDSEKQQLIRKEVLRARSTK